MLADIKRSSRWKFKSGIRPHDLPLRAVIVPGSILQDTALFTEVTSLGLYDILQEVLAHNKDTLGNLYTTN